MYNKFPERLKRLRADKEISQTKIAPLFGVAQQTYAHWESGDSQPDIEILAKMAVFFGVTLDYLVGLSDDIIKPGKAPKGDTSGAYDEITAANYKPSKKAIG